MAKNTISVLMREYAKAIRGDFSLLDETSAQGDIIRFAELTELYSNRELSEQEMRNARQDVDLCVNGRGHWASGDLCSPLCGYSHLRGE